MHGNLFDTIEAGIGDPDASFLIDLQGHKISYGQMIALSGQYANTLAELGVARGDRVAVQTQKCAECLWLYLACLRLGAVYLPLNSAYTAVEIAYFVGDAEPKLFVCDADRLNDLPDALSPAGLQNTMAITAAGDGSLSAKASGMPEQFRTVDLSSEDLAAILYTSGTTGRSKGAMITHETCGPTPGLWSISGVSTNPTSCFMRCLSTIRMDCS